MAQAEEESLTRPTGTREVLRIDRLSPEPADWSELRPVADQLVRRGVLYFGVQDEAVLELVSRPEWRFLWAWGAIGRRIFFGRDEGPWIPYDVRAADKNRRCLVRGRPWPWSFGDDLWIASRFGSESVALHLALDGTNELAFVTRTDIDFRGSVEAWAMRETSHAREIDVGFFRER